MNTNQGHENCWGYFTHYDLSTRSVGLTVPDHKFYVYLDTWFTAYLWSESWFDSENILQKNRFDILKGTAFSNKNSKSKLGNNSYRYCPQQIVAC